MEGFEPPEYIINLIAAVNDGAKTAQAGALALGAVGIYLLAVTVSTTDEDLLLGHTTNLAQLGVQVPPAVSFAIAPMVFVALHVFTLIRYALLGENLKFLSRELESQLHREADRERCRQLLTNIEFVMALMAPQGSQLHSRLFGWIARIIIGIFPIFVLVLVQISALRDQDELIAWTQRLALFLDLGLQTWFFGRIRLSCILAATPLRTSSLSILSRALLPCAIILADSAWVCNLGPNEIPTTNPGFGTLRRILRQPLDEVVCDALQWGCRYLKGDHRLLVGRIWKPDALIDIRLLAMHHNSEAGNSTAAGHDNDTAAIEGASFRYRSLRHADFTESTLFAADMRSADLRGARLSFTNLSHSSLVQANLSDADLSGATLIGVDLTQTTLRRTNLLNADLRHSSGYYTNFDNAMMRFTKLACADLNTSSLVGADLMKSDMRGVDLRGTDLSRANLDGADLNGAIYDSDTKFPNKSFDPSRHKMTKIANLPCADGK